MGLVLDVYRDESSMVRLIIVLALIVFGLFWVSGCSIQLTSLDAVDKRMLELPLMGESKLVREPNSLTVKYQTRLDLSGSCRLPYQRFYYDFVGMPVVTGTTNSGRSYPVLLDTGADFAVITNSLTVLENEWAILPLGDHEMYPCHVGFCELPRLRLGRAVVKDPPCMYLQQQWELRLLGFPLWRQRGLLAGLGLLKHFSYIQFDNIHREAEFCVREAFCAEYADAWDAYPMTIRDERLYVTIPIAGNETEIGLDTCGRYEMVLLPDMWQSIRERLEYDRIRKSKFQSGFLGELPCSRTCIKTMQMGNVTVKNMEVLILPEDSPYMGGYISLACFRDTVVVLDFKNEQLWIRK